ncbi:TIGR04282 family arsenosugar biosynthesis glycosyltransferase [Hyphomicrobium sp. 2TAF46]|uniref:TIGR04282 family arsenosugar biosynthesis glycosyltransferase n=1 Tax=Hyphomicrobium sp. 2TAF46 TaxID=3233019 RepID=UPI003F938EBE
MSLDRHLVLFTRYPSFGTGKRRLAAGVGGATALRFQRVSLSHTLRRLGHDRRWRTWLAVTPDRSGPWPGQSDVVPQGKGDLGQRLARVSSRLPRGPMLIIGSDVPGITKELVAEAFHLLGRHDAVVGPSADGGYWAVGLRRRPRLINPFRAVRWSSPNALEDTLANLRGHSVGRLSSLDDIDDADAMGRYPNWAILHASRLRAGR